MKHRGPFGWRYYGQERPSFALSPLPGQESVWDYPRPPRLEPDARQVVVRAGGETVASSRRAVRVLETASPPTFYLHPDDVRRDLLIERPGTSACEWKGIARYWSVRAGGRVLEDVAWSYPHPLPGFEAIGDHLSFYPGRIECTVDGERVRPQPGGFYGGWITSEIVGPVKGEAGTGGW